MGTQNVVRKLAGARLVHNEPPKHAAKSAHLTPAFPLTRPLTVREPERASQSGGR